MIPEQKTRKVRQFLALAGAVALAITAACAPAAEPDPPVEELTLDPPGEVPRRPDASRWPEFLGPGRDGRSAEDDRLEGVESVRLEPSWSRPLGSGYSGVVVDDGRLFTMFSDGDSDVLVGLSAETGDELWRQELSPTLHDNGGADDGPLSTPAVEDGTVFALAPRGRLVAASTTDGEILWSRDVVEELGGHIPLFLLTTSPMLIGGDLVVQVGAREHGAICGFDPDTGETRWCSGEGSIGYQSPTRMTLLGKPWIVAITDSQVLGLAPESGEQGWELTYDTRGDEGAAHAILAGKDRLLIQGEGGYSLYQVLNESGAISFRPIWKNKEFHQNFDYPVYYQGHLYGFGGRVLICLDAQTGERVWRSTETRGGNGILIGSFLAVWSPKGVLHVARATPDGYEEVAAEKILVEGGYTAPSYANGTLYVRNLNEIAAVRVVPVESP